jgi:hypothetical protein
VGEKSHELDQTDSAYHAGNHTDRAFQEDELPTPLFADERKKGETEVAEDEGF